MDTITHSGIKQMSPQFLVSDIDRSIDFYTTQLGFDLEFRYEDFYAGIIKDGFSIHLKSGDHSIEERTRKRMNDDIDLVFSVDNIEGLFRELTQKQVEIIQPLRKMPYGKEFYIADVDGYIISFVEV
jgi:catechol 2,3-dioxygenase-like lactoylglutathione lyase family enzyme